MFAVVKLDNSAARADRRLRLSSCYAHESAVVYLVYVWQQRVFQVGDTNRKFNKIPIKTVVVKVQKVMPLCLEVIGNRLRAHTTHRTHQRSRTEQFKSSPPRRPCIFCTTLVCVEKIAVTHLKSVNEYIHSFKALLGNARKLLHRRILWSTGETQQPQIIARAAYAASHDLRWYRGNGDSGLQ